MKQLEDRRYSISEVGESIGVPTHVLRHWEAEFKQLKPKRDRANRRYYLKRDIDIARRIKQLMHHDKMTTEGARHVLTKDLLGQGRPQATQEIINRLDAIETEVRSMLETLDTA